MRLVMVALHLSTGVLALYAGIPHLIAGVVDATRKLRMSSRGLLRTSRMCLGNTEVPKQRAGLLKMSRGVLRL